MVINSKEEIELFYNIEMWNPLDDDFSGNINDFLWPHNKTYYNELLPIYTYEFLNPILLNSFKRVLLRDGKIGLTHFFLKYKEPTQLTSTLLIPSHYKRYVPKAWHKQVSLYDHVPDTQAIGDEKKMFFFLNTQDLEYSKNKEVLDEQLKGISERLKNINEIIFIVSEYTINGHFKTLSSREKVLDASISMLKYFPNANYRSLSLEDIHTLNLKDSLFLHFNPDHNFVSDSYIDHLFYHRGGRNVEKINQKSFKEKVRLSPYHSIGISEIDSSANIPLPDLKSLLSDDRKNSDPYTFSFLNDSALVQFFRDQK